MSVKFSVVGKSVPKLDAVKLATGKAEFLDDIKLPGALSVKLFGSTRAHARIKRIDVSRAERLPGVRGIITYKDAPRVPFNPGVYYLLPKDKYLFDEKVRYVGEPVAAVAAVDEDTAEEALSLIEVEYEELPAVFDPVAAMDPKAPRIHPQGNVAAHIAREWGDVEKGFREADHVFEGRYTTGRQVHATIEPHACAASYESGKLTIWTTSQIPFHVRSVLSEVFGLPQHRIRVITSYVGGGFGGKDEVILEPICALMAIKLGETVKLRLTREEVFQATTTRHPSIVWLKTGVKKDGTLVARQVRAILNTGAYASHGPSVAGAMSTRELGLYRSPNVSFEADVVYTNSPTAGAFRGYGNPQQSFAVESQLDEIAEALGIDRVELRLKNTISAGEINPGTGLRIESCGLQECIRRATERICWRQKSRDIEAGKLRNRGLGIACLMHNSGAFPYIKESSSAIVQINEDGTVQVMTGAAEIGQGITTTIAQLVAEELGVDLEKVAVTRPDTDFVPVDRGTYASGELYISGQAARLAAADAKQQLLRKAAEVMKTKPEELEVVQGIVRLKKDPKVRKTIQEIIDEVAIVGKATYMPPSNAPIFGAMCLELEVDPETGAIKVLDIVYAADVGRAINPLIVEGQIEGGAVMGMGFALTEDLVLDSGGRVINRNFTDYKLLHASDLPRIEPVIVESLEPTGPFAAKGVGEPALVPVAPAIANAIYQAAGVRIRDLPITHDKVLKALKELSSRKASG
ncbi:MAG: xanthine dehydrogenase family protein molybdopterin-binding subunit [Candidatus Hadarchaeum sp.]|uniref:xanthine dehydrogenase family protein molybdopterin-binding subunit n=1 Tax=Candidatus Hadarchaeum sp. TaxID=2883567 RepID=UPI003D0972BF